MKKIIFSLLLVVILSLGAVPVLAGSGLNVLTVSYNRNYSVTAGDGVYMVFNLTAVLGPVTINEINVENTDCQINVGHIPSTMNAGESRDISVGITTPSYADTHTIEIEVKYTYMGNQDSIFFSTAISATTVPSTPTTNPNLLPNLVMTEPSSAISITAGSSKQVSVTLKNAGTAAARNITASIVPNEKLNVSFDGSGSISNIGAGSSNTLKMNISAPKDLASGTYPVTVNFIYYDSANKPETLVSTFYIKVTNNTAASTDEDPVLMLDSFSSNPANVEAGNRFTVSAVLKNLTGISASNVQVVITNIDTNIFAIANGSSSSYFGALAGGASQNVSFQLVAAKSLASGSYPINFTVTYNDKDGKVHTANSNYYVSVTGAAATSGDTGVLEIVSINEPTQQYAPDTNAIITMNIKNTSAVDVSDIKISSINPTQGELVPKSSSIQQIRTIKAGETKSVSFSFAPTKAAKTQCYTVGFEIEYKNGTVDSTGKAVTDTFARYVGINVYNPDPEDPDDPNAKVSIPKIIVSRYTVDPIIVQAGHEFDLDINFLNTHALKSVSNIKVSFTVTEATQSKGNVFTPVNSSNTLFIDNIGPKDESSHQLRFYTVPDASPKNYIITLKFEYEDAEGTQYSSTEEIGVNVKQITRLDIGDVYIPDTVMQNEQVYINFQIQNTGRVTLNNLKIKFEGEGFDTMGSDLIFGNFAIGANDYYYATVTPYEAGSKTLSMIITYNDDTGEQQEIINDYHINVMEMSMYDPGMEFPDKDGMLPDDGGIVDGSQKNFLEKNWIWLTIGAVVVLGAVVTTVIVIKKKKMKGLELDE